MLRFLKSIVVFCATIIILFEEWLWDPLKRVMQAFSRLSLIRQLANIIASLPPRTAAFVYLAPMLALLPFKIIGLWLIAQHHGLLGLATLLSAKIVGTALFAWLFGLTKSALMRIAWFAQVYRIVQRISTTAHAWIHRQPLYRWVQTMARVVRNRVRRFLHS